jgi:hypothetical protein
MDALRPTIPLASPQKSSESSSSFFEGKPKINDFFFGGLSYFCFPMTALCLAREISKQLMAHIENKLVISSISSWADVSTAAYRFNLSASFKASVNKTSRLDSLLRTISNLVPTKITFLGGPEKSLSTIDRFDRHEIMDSFLRAESNFPFARSLLIY